MMTNRLKEIYDKAAMFKDTRVCQRGMSVGRFSRHSTQRINVSIRNVPVDTRNVPVDTR